MNEFSWLAVIAGAALGFIVGNLVFATPVRPDSSPHVPPHVAEAHRRRMMGENAT